MAKTIFEEMGGTYVQRLMKNTKWNGYGMLVARIGHTSINIAEEAKRFAACTQKVMALVS